MSIDDEWLCQREWEIVPDDGTSRLTAGSYQLHSTALDLHSLTGWSVERTANGQPVMKDGEPVFVQVDIEPTEAE